VREFDPAAQQSLSAEVERLSKLVDDLYELSLSDSGALSYKKEYLDVVAVLNDTLSMFAERFEQAQLTVAAETARSGPVVVFADAQRLFQLFSNILENSLRYTHPGGQIRVRTEKTADAVVVDFEDSAPGVPAAALAKLFDRFYRVDSSRSRASGGAGLGLAICKNIVAAHGGDITAYASPLGGLWLRVSLPYLR
jgi:two-component system sensor histidine kinase BaeS